MRQKVIVYGFPMWVEYESEDEIPTIGGFWAFMLDLIPWNGMMMEYTGSYWRALWHYLFTPPE